MKKKSKTRKTANNTEQSIISLLSLRGSGKEAYKKLDGGETILKAIRADFKRP